MKSLFCVFIILASLLCHAGLADADVVLRRICFNTNGTVASDTVVDTVPSGDTLQINPALFGACPIRSGKWMAA